MRRLILLLGPARFALVTGGHRRQPRRSGLHRRLRERHEPGRCRLRPCVSGSASRSVVYSKRAQGLFGRRPGSLARRAQRRRARRLRRARLRQDRDNAHADRRHLGPRPDRPAGTAAVDDLHLHRHRRRCEGVRDRHRHPQDAHAVSAAAPFTASTRRCRSGHLRRLSRSRYARRPRDAIGGSIHGVAKGVQLVAVPRAHLRRHGLSTGACSQASTGSPATTRRASPPSRT